MASINEAEEAILEAIANLAKKASSHGGTTHGAMVRDAAIAYRAVVGGQQPGGVPFKE